ncbi:MAG: dephospho-CoA kinase [Chloroflexi bacterium]|nr:dephospho-CoA kinase [Chloroflexota bacterium]MQC27906.1 dephospho-CoA kinase [Chloroflexota bacterium]
MKVLGLTGGIASGKSTAADRLKELGAMVLDADRYGHRAYDKDSEGFHAVVNAFGHDIVGEDGEIDRRVLGGKVFGAPDQLKRLTDIVWPIIRELASAEIAEIREREPETVIVLEAAVLIEAEWQDLADEVWVVTVTPELARKRLMARNNFSEEQAQSRIDAQITNEERVKHADVTIANDGKQDAFRKALNAEWELLTERLKEPAGKGRTASGRKR